MYKNKIIKILLYVIDRKDNEKKPRSVERRFEKSVQLIRKQQLSISCYARTNPLYVERELPPEGLWLRF